MEAALLDSCSHKSPSFYILPQGYRPHTPSLGFYAAHVGVRDDQTPDRGSDDLLHLLQGDG